jgi:hypothetical protein
MEKVAPQEYYRGANFDLGRNIHADTAINVPPYPVERKKQHNAKED